MKDMTTPTVSGGEAGGGDPDEAPLPALTVMRELLVEQAVSLDGIFADLTDYAAHLFRDSPFAAQAYLRLALRAQSSCRSSLEAVVRADRAGAAQEAGAEAGAPAR